jgi:hypothetical protein
MIAQCGALDFHFIYHSPDQTDWRPQHPLQASASNAPAIRTVAAMIFRTARIACGSVSE